MIKDAKKLGRELRRELARRRAAERRAKRQEMRRDDGKGGGVSTGKLLLGAAGLFLFIVGAKKTYQLASGRVVTQEEVERLGEEGNGEEAGTDSRR